MGTINNIVALLLAIVVSDLLSKVFSKIPLIFIQIIVGSLISFLPFFKEFELNPELFMIVLIKPLIFLESQKLSIEEIKKYVRPILSLSLSLAVVSIIFVGSLLKLLIPQMPPAMTFLIVAVMIPINSGIVKELSKDRKFPKAVEHIIEGESLLSDSIAMIIFELTLAASLTQQFYLKEAIYKFVFAMIGGVIVGGIIGFVIINLRLFIVKHNYESPSMMTVIELSTPFIVYVVAEHYFHVSGIIAVIISGILHGIEKPLLNLKSTKLQVISNSTWEVIEYILDGFVAILLGLVLPSSLQIVFHNENGMVLQLLFIAILLYLILAGIRYVWVYLQQEKFHITSQKDKTQKRYIVLYALSSVHGAISVAIALLLPVTTENGIPFSFREELVFVTTIVILISIITPAIVFPKLLEREQPSFDEKNLRQIRTEMIYYTIHQLEEEQNGINDEAILQAVNILKGQLNYIGKGQTFYKNQKEIIHLIHQTTKREIELAEQIIQKEKLSKDAEILYKGYVKRTHDFGIRSLLLYFQISRLKQKLNHKNNLERKEKVLQDFNFIQKYVGNQMIDYLNQIRENENEKEVDMLVQYYEKKSKRNLLQLEKSTSEERIKHHLSNAFHIETVFIKDALEKGTISNDMAKELNKQISYDELIYLD